MPLMQLSGMVLAFKDAYRLIESNKHLRIQAAVKRMLTYQVANLCSYG